MTPGEGVSYVTLISKALHGSMDVHGILWDLSYADGIRLINQYFLDSDETGKAKLRKLKDFTSVDITGLF